MSPKTKSTNNDECYTPPYILDMVREVLGTIDLDPASSLVAQQNVQSVKYFTKQDDGLLRPWHGRIWLNPPYSRPLLASFIDKAITEFAIGNSKEMIILTYSNTDTRWCQKLLLYYSCFVAGRIKFHDANNEVMKRPINSNLITYLGHQTAKFEDVFSKIGVVK